VTEFSIFAWNDINGNGQYDPPAEYGLAGIILKVFDQTGAFMGQGQTDATGFADFFTPNGQGPPFLYWYYADDWVPTSNSPNPIQYNAFGGLCSANFPFQKIQCTYVVSSWVYKVCWVPLKGVRVTYKHGRHHKSYRTFTYPGTVHQDYLDFINAPSKGKWARLLYYTRPCYSVPPSI
jgi:hypothetical protein